MEMEKTFNPQAVESEIYRDWESSGAFEAHRVEGKKPFTIVMPPPNITGQLHMGHALDCTLQDLAVRYHRMKGDPTLWLPGTDHAAIATEVKIVDAMRKEGLTKESLGRKGFLDARGSGRKSTADASSPSSAAWASAATGAASASRWTRAAPRRCARCSSACTKRA